MMEKVLLMQQTRTSINQPVETPSGSSEIFRDLDQDHDWVSCETETSPNGTSDVPVKSHLSSVRMLSNCCDLQEELQQNIFTTKW